MQQPIRDWFGAKQRANLWGRESLFDSLKRLPMTDTSVKRRFWSLTDRLTPIGGTLFCSAVVVFLDVVVSGSYLFAAMICPIWFLVGVVRAIAMRPRWDVVAGRILIQVATLLLVLANHSLQVRIAQANAARLVQACENYRFANKNYPQRLDDLVPRYIRSIPRAKYCLLWRDFQYFSAPPEYWFLVWTKLPPFGRWVYGFDETRDWNYLD